MAQSSILPCVVQALASHLVTVSDDSMPDCQQFLAGLAQLAGVEDSSLCLLAIALKQQTTKQSPIAVPPSLLLDVLFDSLSLAETLNGSQQPKLHVRVPIIAESLDNSGFAAQTRHLVRSSLFPCMAAVSTAELQRVLAFSEQVALTVQPCDGTDRHCGTVGRLWQTCLSQEAGMQSPTIPGQAGCLQQPIKLPAPCGLSAQEQLSIAEATVTDDVPALSISDGGLPLPLGTMEDVGADGYSLSTGHADSGLNQLFNQDGGTSVQALINRLANASSVSTDRFGPSVSDLTSASQTIVSNAAMPEPLMPSATQLLYQTLQQQEKRQQQQYKKDVQGSISALCDFPFEGQRPSQMTHKRSLAEDVLVDTLPLLPSLPAQPSQPRHKRMRNEQPAPVNTTTLSTTTVGGYAISYNTPMPLLGQQRMPPTQPLGVAGQQTHQATTTTHTSTSNPPSMLNNLSSSQSNWTTPYGVPEQLPQQPSPVDTSDTTNYTTNTAAQLYIHQAAVQVSGAPSPSTATVTATAKAIQNPSTQFSMQEMTFDAPASRTHSKSTTNSDKSKRKREPKMPASGYSEGLFRLHTFVNYTQ
eukprot:GFYU01002300.1.p1 GENE.GFYU01002300.1~~GFYU01002300.1.p1  ORF type:complete len:584 (-),score=72.93 GFYU01002300.1:189-1940(-)